MSLVGQIRSTIEQHSLVSAGDRVVVGVSGGPDSLTLLHVLRTLQPELRLELRAAHLNHRLRGSESDEDARFVESLANEWRLPFSSAAVDVATLAHERRQSIEETGRQERYRFLVEIARQIGAQAIAVAHHADDQVETLVMHWLRGAGLAGLRGMQYRVAVRDLGLDDAPEAPPLCLIRPLLDVSRGEIESYCRQNYLTPRYDRSNEDNTYFRNRMRNDVVPYLEALNPNLRRTLIRASRSLSDEYDFVQQSVQAAFAAVARDRAGAIVFDRAAWGALHPAVQRGTLRAAVHRLSGNLRDLDWTPIEDARRVAMYKGSGSIATLPNGLRLTVGYAHFEIAPTGHSASTGEIPLLNVERVDLPAEGVTPLPGTPWSVRTRVSHRREESEPVPSTRWSATFDWTRCEGSAWLRRRRAGDRFQPAGLGGHSQTLHDYMINARIERAVRRQLPLLVVDDRITWVCGWRIDERSRVTGETHDLWRVSFQNEETN